MAINCSREDEPEPEEKYPLLKKSKTLDIVVLFNAPRTGMVVFSTDPGHMVGLFADCWTFDGFIKYNGTVLLENA